MNVMRDWELGEFVGFSIWKVLTKSSTARNINKSEKTGTSGVRPPTPKTTAATYNDGTNVKCHNEQNNVNQQVDAAASGQENGNWWQENGQDDQKNLWDVSHDLNCISNKYRMDWVEGYCLVFVGAVVCVAVVSQTSPHPTPFSKQMKRRISVDAAESEGDHMHGWLQYFPPSEADPICTNWTLGSGISINPFLQLSRSINPWMNYGICYLLATTDELCML